MSKSKWEKVSELLGLWVLTTVYEDLKLELNKDNSERRVELLTEAEVELLTRFVATEATTIDSLEEISQELDQRLRDEEERVKLLESKAISLVGFGGLSISVLLAILSTIDSLAQSLALRFAFSMCMLSIGLLLSLSVYLATQATRVGKFAYKEPNVEDLPELLTEPRLKILRSRANDKLSAYLHNRHIGNAKAEFVNAGQLLVRNTLLLGALGILLLSFHWITVGSDKSYNMPRTDYNTGTVIKTQTQTSISTTIVSPVPTVTQTAQPQLQTPSQTTSTP